MTPRGEDRLINSALRAIKAGDPEPVLRLVERGILPTDAPVVAEAWALTEARTASDQTIPSADERVAETQTGALPVSTDETLTLRTNHRDHIEYETPDGDLLVLHQVMVGDWLVTATISDADLTQVQGRVIRNEAGFAGRNWESAIDGQQYPSLQAAAREALSLARQRADLAAFARVAEDRKARPAQYQSIEERYAEDNTSSDEPFTIEQLDDRLAADDPKIDPFEALASGAISDHAFDVLTGGDEPINPEGTGWFRLSDMGDGTYLVEDTSGTIRSLTFGGVQAHENALAAAMSLSAAMDRSEDDLHAKRAEWLPVARATLGQDPVTGDDVAPTTILADVIAKALTPVPGIEPVEAQRQMAEAVLKALEVAGFAVLDSCARCGEDPRAHWCADLEETFN